MKLVFLIVLLPVPVLGLPRRESWWKDAEILMLRHQLAVARPERPAGHSRLTWPGRAWLALPAGTLPAGRLAAMRLIVTPGTVLRWHRGTVRRRWARLPRRGRSGRPPARRKVADRRIFVSLHPRTLSTTGAQIRQLGAWDASAANVQARW